MALSIKGNTKEACLLMHSTLAQQNFTYFQVSEQSKTITKKATFHQPTSLLQQKLITTKQVLSVVQQATGSLVNSNSADTLQKLKLRLANIPITSTATVATPLVAQSNPTLPASTSLLPLPPAAVGATSLFAATPGDNKRNCSPAETPAQVVRIVKKEASAPAEQITMAPIEHIQGM